MSIEAVRWGLRQDLPPTPKLVLVALGESADDQGVCWPSVPTLARRCSLSVRTVQRILHDIEASGRMRIEPRYRADGSRTSNRYVLLLDKGDPVSERPVVSDRAPPPRRPSAGDAPVTPGTTREPSRKSPRPRRQACGTVAPVAGTAPDRDGGQVPGLVFPKGLSEAERSSARRQLASFPEALAQQLLDELAGRMAAGAIQVAPLAYLRGLVRRARQGRFTPELALRVSDQRRRRQQAEAALRRVKAAPVTAQPAVDSPLVVRLEAIRRRSSRGTGDGR